MRNEILRPDPDGSVTLPDGSKADVALADALGFIVIGGRTPTLEARAEAAAKVAGARARNAVLRPAPPIQAAPAPQPTRAASPDRSTRAPIPRATTSAVLKQGARGMVGMVELPCGRIVSTEAATAAGYVVEGSTAALALAAQEKRDARAATILSLPEATGRSSAALQVVESTMPLAEASRFLASLPEDEAPAPPQAVAPADPRAARLAEIAAMGAAHRRTRA